MVVLESALDGAILPTDGDTHITDMAGVILTMDGDTQDTVMDAAVMDTTLHHIITTAMITTLTITAPVMEGVPTPMAQEIEVAGTWLHLETNMRMHSVLLQAG